MNWITEPSQTAAAMVGTCGEATCRPSPIRCPEQRLDDGKGINHLLNLPPPDPGVGAAGRELELAHEEPPLIRGSEGISNPLQEACSRMWMANSAPSEAGLASRRLTFTASDIGVPWRSERCVSCLARAALRADRESRWFADGGRGVLQWRLADLTVMTAGSAGTSMGPTIHPLHWARAHRLREPVPLAGAPRSR
jgi:hypothetical protein